MSIVLARHGSNRDRLPSSAESPRLLAWSLRNTLRTPSRLQWRSVTRFGFGRQCRINATHPIGEVGQFSSWQCHDRQMVGFHRSHRLMRERATLRNAINPYQPVVGDSGRKAPAPLRIGWCVAGAIVGVFIGFGRPRSMIGDAISDPLWAMFFLGAWLGIASLFSLVRIPRARRPTNPRLDRAVRIIGGLVFGYAAVSLAFPIDLFAAQQSVPLETRTSVWFGLGKLLPAFVVSVGLEAGLAFFLRDRVALPLATKESVGES